MAKEERVRQRVDEVRVAMTAEQMEGREAVAMAVGTTAAAMVQAYSGWAVVEARARVVTVEGARAREIGVWVVAAVKGPVDTAATLATAVATAAASVVAVVVATRAAASTRNKM